MGGISVVESDEQYETENDARILRQAEEIKVDAKRFKRAAKELEKQAKAMKRASAAVNVEKGLAKTFTSS